MKKLFFMLGTIAALTFMFSCKGPEGPAGPTGPTGPTGNEEVYLYSFGSLLYGSMNGYYNSYSFGTLPKSTIDKSLILAYYYTADWGDWNTVNGPGPGGDYQSVMYYHEADSTVKIYFLNGDGSGYTGADVTWDSTKIYLIPPSIMRAAEQQNVDFSNMRQVDRFINEK
jgi:hypothetical protein